MQTYLNGLSDLLIYVATVTLYPEIKHTSIIFISFMSPQERAYLAGPHYYPRGID